MFGLMRFDTILGLKTTLPLDGSNMFRLNFSKVVPLLLTPLKLTKLVNVLKPVIFMLLRLCSSIVPLCSDPIVLYELGQATRWTQFCYSPHSPIALRLLKLLTLALTAMVMYNPGATAKFIAFIYVVLMVVVRLITWAVLLMFKLITLLARLVIRDCLRRFRSKCCYKLS